MVLWIQTTSDMQWKGWFMKFHDYPRRCGWLQTIWTQGIRGAYIKKTSWIQWVFRKNHKNVSIKKINLKFFSLLLLAAAADIHMDKTELCSLDWVVNIYNCQNNTYNCLIFRCLIKVKNNKKRQEYFVGWKKLRNLADEMKDGVPPPSKFN